MFPSPEKMAPAGRLCHQWRWHGLALQLAQTSGAIRSRHLPVCYGKASCLFLDTCAQMSSLWVVGLGMGTAFSHHAFIHYIEMSIKLGGKKEVKTVLDFECYLSSL